MTTISVHDRFPDGTAGSVCYRCRRHPREEFGRTEKVIDLGIHIEMEGGLAFCETCVTEIGRAVGMVTAADVDEIRAQLASAREDTETAQQLAADCVTRAEAAEAAVAAIAAATRRLPEPEAAPSAGKRRQAQPA